jgi:hypothetical protein
LQLEVTLQREGDLNGVVGVRGCFSVVCRSGEQPKAGALPNDNSAATNHRHGYQFYSNSIVMRTDQNSRYVQASAPSLT